MTAYRPISDYGLIGDSRSAALVSREGSIDWLCAPRFDSPSLFNALLDPWRGGRFSVRPAARCATVRRYLPGTAILETEFRGAGFRLRLTDFSPGLGEDERRRELLPMWSVARLLEVLEGEVDVDVLFKPRPRDGLDVPKVARPSEGLLRCEVGEGLALLAADGPLETAGGEGCARWRLRAGQTRALWLGYDESGPAIVPSPARVPELLRLTERFWRAWSERCRACAHRPALVRSAITLKLLSYAPTGAVIAAPTTSLPERIGGRRNWDYRFCWLRDASLAACLFYDLGFSAEAHSYVHWLTYATVRTHPELRVFYDLFGEPAPAERELPALAGYAHSWPARAGNAAEHQYQLDAYGYVLDALRFYADAGEPVDREMRRTLLDYADYAAAHWTRPDHGIWEVRGARRHYVHSKAMCWAALGDADALAESLELRADRARWRGARRAIERALAQDGWSPRKASFVQRFGSEALDATALLLVSSGFLEPSDPRAESTVRAVGEELGEGDLVRRYRSDDGLGPPDGAFLPCSFWLVEALLALGRVDEAAELFERLERRANDVGLYAEEAEPRGGGALGNFPQAFTHIAHASAALRLDAALSPRGRREPRRTARGR